MGKSGIIIKMEICQKWKIIIISWLRLSTRKMEKWRKSGSNTPPSSVGGGIKNSRSKNHSQPHKKLITWIICTPVNKYEQ